MLALRVVLIVITTIGIVWYGYQLLGPPVDKNIRESTSWKVTSSLLKVMGLIIWWVFANSIWTATTILGAFAPVLFIGLVCFGVKIRRRQEPQLR